MAATAATAATTPLISRFFHWKPLAATCAALGTSMITGDLICQVMEGRTFHSSLLPWNDSPRPSNTIDTDRARAMFLTGLTVTGPYSHAMMMGLERYFPGNALRTAVLPKLAINIGTAPIGIALAFTSVALYKNQTIEHAQQRVQNDLLPTYMKGALYWPFVSFMNLRFVPLYYRPAVGGVAGAIWNVYISSVANKQPQSTAPLPMTSSSSFPSSSSCPTCSKPKSDDTSLSISCSCPPLPSLTSPAVAAAAVTVAAS